MSLPLHSLVLIVCLSIITAVAAVIDLRTRKIPNKLTLPAFILGLVFQLVFHPYATTIGGSLFDSALAFALGFGTLFILWMIGGGGAGDAKLMGALSVWLGFRMTIAVLILSTLFAAVGTLAVTIYQGARRGAWGAQRQLATSGAGGRAARLSGDSSGKPARRIMTYALSVALATWTVLLWFHLKQNIGQ